MKYIKSFGDFLYEKELHEKGFSYINESTKWTKDNLPALEKFLPGFRKMTEGGEYDPKTARTSTAILDIWEMGAMFFMIEGRNIWKIQNPDKCKPSKWDRFQWIEGNQEDADKWTEAVKKEIDALKAGFEMSVDAISSIEKGNADKLESVVAKLAKHMDACFKMNRKIQKSFDTRPTCKADHQEEENEFFRKFHDEMLDKLINATSNEKAVEKFKEKYMSK